MLDALELHTKRVGETANLTLAVEGVLDAGELASGMPTVAITGPDSALTASAPTVSTAALTVSGISYPAGEALTTSVAAGTAGARYVLTFTFDTDGSPAQIRVRSIALDVIADA